MLKRHHPILERKLRTLVAQGRGEDLLRLMQGLSHQDARSGGYLLGHKLLPAHPEHYWALFSVVVPFSAKAYLGTFLNGAVVLLRDKRLRLDEERLQQFAKTATAIDAHKILAALLPELSSPTEVHFLVHTFTDGSGEQMASALLGYTTTACCYEFFQVCKQLDGEREVLRHYCVLLMQRGERVHYNLASMIQSYFDLGALPGTFSLRMKTYELSRLDLSFEAFSKVLHD